jgi:hypothetical protein
VKSFDRGGKEEISFLQKKLRENTVYTFSSQTNNEKTQYILFQAKLIKNSIIFLFSQ